MLGVVLWVFLLMTPATRCKNAWKPECGHLACALYLDRCWRAAALVGEANALLTQPGVFRSSESHSVYQEELDAEFPDTHPRNQLQESSKRIVHFGMLPVDSPLR